MSGCSRLAVDIRQKSTLEEDLVDGAQTAVKVFFNIGLQYLSKAQVTLKINNVIDVTVITITLTTITRWNETPCPMITDISVSSLMT